MKKNILKNKKGYLNFLIKMAAPTLLMIISMILIFAINFRNYKNQLQQDAISSLEHFAVESETNINSIINQTAYLFNDSIFVDAMDNLSTINQDKISHLCNTLDSFKKISHITDEIFIIDQNNNKVINSYGLYESKTFFNSIYNYDTYKLSYWNNYKMYSSAPYRSLSPTTVSDGNNSKNIIPIIIRSINDTSTKNLLVINVDIKTLLMPDKAYSFTDNTGLYLLNNYSGQVFSNSSDKSFTLSYDDPLYKGLISGNEFFDLNIENIGKCTIAASSLSNSFIGYTYYAVIPIADITKMLFPIMLYSFIIALFTIGFSAYFMLNNTNKTYEPLREMADILTPDKGLDLTLMRDSAINLSTKNSNLSTLIPYAQERYLINYLNSTEYGADENTQSIVKNMLPFKYDYFAVVVIQLVPLANMYDSYTSTECNNILSGFYNIVKDIFIEKFDSLVLSSERQTLYIILNIETDKHNDDINAIIKNICGYLQNDLDYVKLSIGNSKIYKYMSGLKQAHNEALSLLKIVPKQKDRIIFNISNPDEITFTYTDNDDNNLFNTIINFKTEKAIELIDNITKKNSDITNRALRQLYTQILMTIFRAMRVKKIKYSEDKLDFEILNDICERPIPEIKSEIQLLLQHIKEYEQVTDTSLAQSIIQYIDENFDNPDISLDYIASLFRANSSYISAALSMALGSGFHEYLTGLRISHAKTQLAQTSRNIQEICDNCGFSSIQTFYRIFKKYTGTTPSAYRKMSK